MSTRRLGIGALTLVLWVALLIVLAIPADTDVAPGVTIGTVSAVQYSTAQVSGTVNPNGGPSVTSWRFEYSTDGGVEWVPATGTPAASGELTGAQSAEHTAIALGPVTLEGLTPNTTYDVRLVASNEEGAKQSATEAPYPTFTTLIAPLSISEQHVSNVKATSARFGGEINPGGAETTYHFEYDTTPYTTNSPHGTPTPTVPVGTFELTLPEGKYSALVANGNLCTSKLAMPTSFLGQNGAEIHESTKITATGCARVKKAAKKRHAKSHRRGRE
jgi:hypothetical protein